MATESEYGAFRLKKDTVEFLQTMKQAFELSYDKKFTNDEFIRQMAASVEDGDVAVWEIYCTMEMQKEELAAKAKEIRERNSK